MYALCQKLYTVLQVVPYSSKLYALRLKLNAFRQKLYESRQKLYDPRQKVIVLRQKFYAPRQKLNVPSQKLYALRQKLYTLKKIYVPGEKCIRSSSKVKCSTTNGVLSLSNLRVVKVVLICIYSII